jgi:hypothetical protein
LKTHGIPAPGMLTIHRSSSPQQSGDAARPGVHRMGGACATVEALGYLRRQGKA